MQLVEKNVYCPYCGELISVLIDDSVPQQDYIEDCQVCCRPIFLNVTVFSDDAIEVQVLSENE